MMQTPGAFLFGQTSRSKEGRKLTLLDEILSRFARDVKRVRFRKRICLKIFEAKLHCFLNPFSLIHGHILWGRLS